MALKRFEVHFWTLAVRNLFSALQGLFFQIDRLLQSSLSMSCGDYRLVESCHIADDRICHHSMLNINFISDFVLGQLNIIQKLLTLWAEGKRVFFPKKIRGCCYM